MRLYGPAAVWHRTYGVRSALAIVWLLAACGGGADVVGGPVGGGPGGGGGGGSPPGPPVTSQLTCAQPGGGFTQCDLTLTAAGGFNLVLNSRSCAARGNSLRIVKPVVQTLTTDGCYEPVGKSWAFPGPYAAGTAVSFDITSPTLAHPASLHASGAYPSWEIDFEDGGDSDFNDLVLQLTATP